MNGATMEKREQAWSYLLLGALLAVLAVSFRSAWEWSSESWFRIGLTGGSNASYSPGPLIPVMVLLMLGTRLKRLPVRPEVAKRDWFYAAYQTFLLPAITAVSKAWHRFRNISADPQEQQAWAHKHRATSVWVVWGVLAVALALSLSGARSTPILKPIGLSLLFVHVMVFSAAVLYVAWRIFQCDEKAQVSARGWLMQAQGLVLVLLCLMLHFAAVRGQMDRLSIISFLGCLVGIIWYFYSWRVARIFLFPLAFMIFTLPMEWIEDRFGLPAQIFATKHSVNIMSFLGVQVQMIGLTSFKILKGATPIDFSVAAPCSGLKSLVALTAISATYAYVTQKTHPKMLVIMAFGPAIAIVTNMVRLVAVGVVAQFWGRGSAMAVHDNALPIYILGILLLLGIDKLINSKWLKIEDF